jgi:AcrR family transcriptional regulator
MAKTHRTSREKGPEKYAKKETLIMEEAMKLFFIYGFKKTTVDDIVNKTGMAKASFYKYFDSKDDLFNKFLSMIEETGISRIKNAIKVKKTAKEKLKALVMEQMKFFVEFFETRTSNHYVNKNYLLEVEVSRNRFFDMQKCMIKKIFSDGVKADEIKKMGENEIEILTDAFVIMTKALERLWVFERKVCEIEPQVDFYMDILFEGLGK